MTAFPFPTGFIPPGLLFLIGSVISPKTSIPLFAYLAGAAGEGGIDERMQREKSVSCIDITDTKQLEAA